jgi:hypothetical protein
VRADDDRAPGLQRDQDLVDGRGRGIGRRHDGRHDAEGLGDLDDLAILEAGDDADRFHRPDEVVDLLRREEVLFDLVGDDPVAGLLVRQPRERLGLRRDRRRHGVHDRVDLGLGQFRQRRRGLFGAACEGAGFADRSEVAIGRGRGLRGHA